MKRVNRTAEQLLSINIYFSNRLVVEQVKLIVCEQELGPCVA